MIRRWPTLDFPVDHRWQPPMAHGWRGQLIEDGPWATVSRQWAISGPTMGRNRHAIGGPSLAQP